MKVSKLYKLAKEIRKLTSKEFPRCKDFSIGCYSCQANRTLDEMMELVDYIRELEKM